MKERKEKGKEKESSEKKKNRIKIYGYQLMTNENLEHSYMYD